MRYSPIALLIASTLVASVSHAANTISFEGEINEQTCKVSIDGQPNAVVKLPTVSKTEMPNNGDVAGETPFTLSITDCAPGKNSQKVAIKLNKMSLSNGHLANDTGAGFASGVAVQLLDDQKNKINLENLYTVDMGEIGNTDGQVAKKTLTAQYVREGDITGGQVKTVVEYELNYL